MCISYDKLWKLMMDKKINKTKLRQKAKITSNALAKLGKDESVQLETIVKVKVLDCNINDVVKIKY